MASVSPALSNNSADTTSNTGYTSSAVVRTTSTTPTPTLTPMVISNSSINTSKNLRGLNKPKCIKCGNVARSRCPYQACKSCCAKAQNPCHIHVLKGNTSFPDNKTPSSTSSSLTFQQSNEASSSSGNAHRVTSLRQLSNNFAQFNNLQTPARARKPLTRKEASQINEWRFSKLKEYKNRNIEMENESFDRYLQNMTLLEDIFGLKSNLEEEKRMMVSKLKIKKTENLRDRMRFIVNNSSSLKDVETETQESIGPKKARYSGLVELNKKLTNARTDEDLKSCRLLLKAQLLKRRPEDEQKSSRRVGIDEEALAHIDPQFTALKEIEQL